MVAISQATSGGRLRHMRPRSAEPVRGRDPGRLLVAWRRLMGSLVRLVRSRVLPAILAALGVSFVAAGLLFYTVGPGGDLFPFSGDVTARSSPAGAADPTGVTGPTNSQPPVPPATDGPVPTTTSTTGPSAASTTGPSPSNALSPSPDPTVLPGGSGGPTARATSPGSSPSVTATPPATHVATRVVVPALGIDLPVVRQPSATSYPFCNVAMYIEDLPQPGGRGATYLYAHARTGMFLPLLDQSEINNGRAMLGMLVQVYTSDDRYLLYEITEVRRHQVSLADAIAAKVPQLWLQTSEGPRGTPGKLQVIAMPLNTGPASPADAHPTAAPVVCG